MEGFSFFKLYLVLVKYNLDVVCVQEMWLSEKASSPNIPGYRVFEHRREKGSRGGIAIFVRKELTVFRDCSNEYA